MISHTRLPLFSRAYAEKIGEPGDEARFVSCILNVCSICLIPFCIMMLALVAYMFDSHDDHWEKFGSLVYGLIILCAMTECKRQIDKLRKFTPRFYANLIIGPVQLLLITVRLLLLFLSALSHSRVIHNVFVFTTVSWLYFICSGHVGRTLCQLKVSWVSSGSSSSQLVRLLIYLSPSTSVLCILLWCLSA